MHIDRKQELQEQVTTGFFGFWVRKYRISYLITGVIVLMGLIAAMQIPKESSPNVEFGIILINTVYP